MEKMNINFEIEGILNVERNINKELQFQTAPLTIYFSIEFCRQKL